MTNIFFKDNWNVVHSKTNTQTEILSKIAVKQACVSGWTSPSAFKKFDAERKYLIYLFISDF